MIDDRDLLEREMERMRPRPIGVDDLIRRRERRNRNQRIAAGVVAIAVFVVPVWFLSTDRRSDRFIHSPATVTTATSQPAVEGILGLPPEGATPSTPARGQNVLHFWFGHTSGDAGRFSLYLYADGRVIVERLEGGPEVSSHGYLEQRLTPEGVDLVLAEVLSTGLLDHDRALQGSLGLNGGGIAVRSDDRLTQLVWGDTDFEHGNKPAATAPTPEEVRTLEALDARLEDLTSWLPASAWEDPEVKAFVASRFTACYLYTGPDETLGRLGVLDLLPPPAGDMIRPLDVTQSYPNGYRASRPFWCSEMSIEQARQLVAVLPGAGAHSGSDNGLSYHWSTGEPGGAVDLDLGPALP